MRQELNNILSYELKDAWLNENYAYILSKEIQPLLKKDIPMLHIFLIKFYQNDVKKYDVFGKNPLILNKLKLTQENSKPNNKQLELIKINLMRHLNVSDDMFIELILKNFYSTNNRSIQKFVQIFDFYANETNDESIQNACSTLISTCYQKQTNLKWDLTEKVTNTMAQTAMNNKLKVFFDS